MKKIRTITFHHAYNFGSVLQAYALQEFVRSMAEVDYQIINFYTDFQEKLYGVLNPFDCCKNMVKNAIALPYVRQLRERHEKFDEFLASECSLTERYKTLEQLEAANVEADYFISGSDQLWNVRSQDFSDAYYLPFVKCGRKCSYAASFGPLKINWAEYDKEKYARLLSEYQYISVRENGSAENIKMLLSDEAEVNVDPTLLLSEEQWRKIESDADYNDGEYILLYCLEPSKEQLAMAEAISERLKLPIVITRYNNKNDMFNRFVKRYNAGPRDFLSYIDHAKLVLTSSFHGTAFSLIYGKPFYAFNGMADNRISNILRATGQEERSIDSMADVGSVTITSPDKSKIQGIINSEIEKSRRYLEECLEIE